MKVKVKLFASLQKGRFQAKDVECREGTTIKELMDELGVPEKEYFITFINNLHADHERELKEGDNLSVFPAVGGG
jgi:molybdopterin converting factor small subunit